MSEQSLTLAPPEPITVPGSDLVLAPPAPPPVVAEEQAAGMIPVKPEVKAEIAIKAKTFADDLATLDVRSPEFSQKVGQVTSMGQAEIVASSQVSNRMLERPAAALAAAKGAGNAGDAQVQVAKTLGDLRTTITELDPARADLTGVKKVLKFLPGGNKLQRYFNKYQSAQGQIDAIIKALASGQDGLRKDNAAIEGEKSNMWTTMQKMSEYSLLAGELDRAVEAKVAELRAAGRVEDATTLEADALFPIRQRRQDILTQLAVSAQGYLALDLVRKNNIELIKGVDRAQTTTISALRTAVIVAQALANQQLVLEQITALNTTTSAMIRSTSELLQTQGAAIQQQASSTTVDIADLQAAFDNVFATMDAVDSFRSAAAITMGQSVQALEGQIERAKPYLERTRANENRQS
jgi:uncharacterized protein YaaN involved in tellurite resistance